jgi:hypothetical protein
VHPKSQVPSAAGEINAVSDKKRDEPANSLTGRSGVTIQPEGLLAFALDRLLVQ